MHFWGYTKWEYWCLTITFIDQLIGLKPFPALIDSGYFCWKCSFEQEEDYLKRFSQAMMKKSEGWPLEDARYPHHPPVQKPHRALGQGKFHSDVIARCSMPKDFFFSCAAFLNVWHVGNWSLCVRACPRWSPTLSSKYRTGISSLKGQGFFHFAKGTSIVKSERLWVKY